MPSWVTGNMAWRVSEEKFGKIFHVQLCGQYSALTCLNVFATRLGSKLCLPTQTCSSQIWCREGVLVHFAKRWGHQGVGVYRAESFTIPSFLITREAISTRPYLPVWVLGSCHGISSQLYDSKTTVTPKIDNIFYLSTFRLNFSDHQDKLKKLYDSISPELCQGIIPISYTTEDLKSPEKLEWGLNSHLKDSSQLP